MASTLYDILGVSSFASLAEIKAAYKSLAKKHHPDINNGSSWHEEQFKKINQAYQILSDAGKRRQYDSRLEYEAFVRQNPVYQQPTPSQKQTNQTHKKSTHQHTTSSNKKPPVSSKKKSYIVTISDKEINLLVVGYYAVLILLLGSFYELREYFKIKNLMEQAQAYESKNEYSRAIGFYTSVLTIDNEHTKAYEKRAEAKIKLLADYEWALNDFTASILYTRKPSDSLWYKRARCFFHLKRYEAAINDIDHIVKGENPSIDSAYFYKAECNYYLKNYTMSIPDYTQYLKLQPQSGQVYTHRGYCYYILKQYPKAINDYTAAINWQPYNAEHYYYRGLSKIGLADIPNACTDLTDAFLLGSVEAGVAKSTYCPKSNL